MNLAVLRSNTMTQAYSNNSQQHQIQAQARRDTIGNPRAALNQQQENLKQILAYFKGDYLNLDQ